jgi:hypothetical protein
MTILLASAAIVGCNSTTKKPGSSEDVAVGTVSARLVLGSVTINTINWHLTGTTTLNGTFNVAGPGSTFTGIIPNVPVGTYNLSLDTPDNATCHGMTAMSFMVTRRSQVTVNIHLYCEGTGQNVGSIMVNGDANVCPTADNITAPATATVGTAVSVIGTGSDSDGLPMPLSYHWSVPAGDTSTFGNANVASTTFTCGSNGTHTLSLTVSDGDAVCATAFPADVTVTQTISCSGGTGGAGTGAAGTGTAGTGTAGTGTAGTGTAGTGTAGTGTAGTGTAGTGGGNACLMCETADQFCAPLVPLCDNLTGNTSATSPLMPNTPKAALCHAVLDCMRMQHCAQNVDQGTQDCFCGIGADPVACFTTGTFASATGLCKDIMAAGLETTTISELSARFSDPNYATGAAVSLTQCDESECNTQCL